MQSLIKNKDNIFDIKKKVENLDNSLFTYFNINNYAITDKTISIIMTSSNRSIQTYMTFNTIMNSKHSDIHIIIVDDSDIDPIKKEELYKYPFHIDFISINRQNKKWHNPSINYNIGFKFIKGVKVMIQNAEVCHIGDILSYMTNETILDNHYYVFDVKASKSFATNDIIYKSNTNTTDIYKNEDLFKIWYQGPTRICNYHFLTGMTRNTFELIKNFSYDYAFGSAFDDDDFLLKIKSKNINIVNIFHDKNNIGGIHLYHQISTKTWNKNKEINDILFNNKLNYYNKNNIYLDISDNYNNFDIEYNNLNNSNKIEIKINKESNLLLIQKNIIDSTINSKIINILIDKKDLKNKNINTFYKCIKKGYCYQNSTIKIPINLIKFSFI